MSVDPIRRTVVVEAPIEDAWVVFTGRMSAWWPMATHSLGQEDVETVILEPRAGGRFFERRHDGSEHDWGRVLAWDPPNLLTVEWGITADNGGAATEWEVRFTAIEDGTRVELEHRGWERLATRGDERRADYDGGWPAVLDAYTGARALAG